MSDTVQLPLPLWRPHEPFVEDYATKAAQGASWLANANVAVVACARNCGVPLAKNIDALQELLAPAKSWRMHVEANDCVDDTLLVLVDYSRRLPQFTFHYRDLGHAQFGHEFAGRRTVAMATHRTACQRWVKSCVPAADIVLVVDVDMWGGFNADGVLNGIGWLLELPGAFGMASVSLFQHDWGGGAQWAHYDLWALRGVGQASCYWDTYTTGYGGWAYSWLPPIGTPPVLVSSAFGGLTIYRADAFLAGTYDGTSDCEHVPFHASITEATGQRLYVNPSQRSVMHWVTDARQHGHD